jgi:hypothetical protein
MPERCHNSWQTCKHGWSKSNDRKQKEKKEEAAATVTEEQL